MNETTQAREASIMRYSHLLIKILFAFCFQLSLLAQQHDNGWLLTDVTLTDMTSGKISEGNTIWISNGKVEALNPNNIPKNIEKVSAGGRFVIPGLSEMHAHVPTAPDYTDRVLKLFVAHGVTNIRGMLGQPSHLELRQQLNSGSKLGPYLVTSGPSINGNSVRSPQQAISKITQQVNAGYDFHKIHPGMSAESYMAATQTAGKLHSSWGGHISMEVGIVDTVKAGQATIDHLDGFIEELAVRNGGDAANRGFFGFSLAHKVRDDAIAKLVKQLTPYQYAVVPTETLMQSLAGNGSTELLMKNPAHRWMPKSVVDGWKNARNNFWNDESISKQQAERFIQVRQKLLSELNKQGAIILLGSDAPQWFNVPGDSLHKELALMVEAGMTPLQALRSGTQNVYDFYQGKHPIGKIAPGLRADLVLLEKNPLESIQNTRTINAVVIAGKLLDRGQLDAILESLE